MSSPPPQPPVKQENHFFLKIFSVTCFCFSWMGRPVETDLEAGKRESGLIQLTLGGKCLGFWTQRLMHSCTLDKIIASERNGEILAPLLSCWKYRARAQLDTSCDGPWSIIFKSEKTVEISLGSNYHRYHEKGVC